jgi:hypothetical protein
VFTGGGGAARVLVTEAVLVKPPTTVIGSSEEVLDLVIVEEFDADTVAFSKPELPDGGG